MITTIRKVQLAIFIGLLFLGGVSAFAFMYTDNNPSPMKQPETQVKVKGEAYKVTGPLTVDVILKREYLDGEISKEIVQETIWSMEDFWSKYESWQLIDQKQGQVVFGKKISDISPLMKANGYFGISKDGVLSLFEGKPQKEKIIQSFFQIDIKKLESHQQKELMKGIPVRSKDNYIEVIESFKHYSSLPSS